MYIVFLLDWQTVFQRKQILVLRLEDYAADIKVTMNKVFEFLTLGRSLKCYSNISDRYILCLYFKNKKRNIMSPCSCIIFKVLNQLVSHFLAGPLSEQEQAAVTKPTKSNSRRAADKDLGPMLPATSNLLRKFYQPFNHKLASVLDNKAFLWSKT